MPAASAESERGCDLLAAAWAGNGIHRGRREGGGMGRLHGRVGRGHLCWWRRGLRHGRRMPHGLHRSNGGRGNRRVLPGPRCGHGCGRCDSERTLSGGNLHGNGVHADLNRRPRSRGSGRWHARAGAKGRRGSRGWCRRRRRGRCDACALHRARAVTRRQDGRRHDGGPRGREGLGGWRHCRLGHADRGRHRHGLRRRCRRVHVRGRHGLGRRCSRAGLELGPTAQTELVKILVFLTATRTGDHDRPSARIVGVSLFIKRILPR